MSSTLKLKLKPEIKAEWVTRLRSGRYTQGSGRLKTVTRVDGKEVTATYCCLGVLCEIAAEQGVGRWGTPNPIRPEDNTPTQFRVPFAAADGNGEDAGTLPYAVGLWAFDLETYTETQSLCNPVLRPYDDRHPNQEQTAAGMNDSQIPFRTIADDIEANL